MCVPPPQARALFAASCADPPYRRFQRWVKQSSYIQYVPIAFHWNTKLTLPRVWGFPKSDWGIAFIVLTDYMQFASADSKTVITTCITRLDSPSAIGTANSVASQTKLKQEVFRQLQLSFPDLPSPTHAILHEHVRRQDGAWVDANSAFVQGLGSWSVPAQTRFAHISYVGTQNGHSPYHFTSLESAVANALYFINRQDPSCAVPLRSITSLVNLVQYAVLGLGSALAMLLTLRVASRLGRRR